MTSAPVPTLEAFPPAAPCPPPPDLPLSLGSCVPDRFLTQGCILSTAVAICVLYSVSLSPFLFLRTVR